MTKKNDGKVIVWVMVILICVGFVAGFLYAKKGGENSNGDVTNNVTSGDKEIDASKQLTTILNNKDLWYKTTESEKFSYAVTDLDQNGRLEIISSICQGSGMYSSTTIYEVNLSGDGLLLCESDLSEGDSQADIIKNNWNVYYDEATKEYNYIFGDVIRISGMEHVESKRAFILKDGQITEKYLVQKNILSHDEEQETQYTDFSNNEITEEEYNNFENEYFANLEKMQVNIEWLVDYNNITISELENSYNKFALTK